MQALLWTVLGAALGVGCIPPGGTCQVSRYDETPGEARLAAAGGRATVMWSHTHGDHEGHSMYTASVATDGTLGPAQQLDDASDAAIIRQWPDESGLGEVGAATVLWGTSHRCLFARFTYVHPSGQTDPRPGMPKRLQVVQLAGSGDEASRVDIDVASDPVEYEVNCGLD